MKTKNTCYTYFKIVGDFIPDDVSARLGLEPSKSWKIGDCRKDGTLYDFALWEYGRCDEYDVFVENQMRKTISELLNKIDVLNQIRNDFDVQFYLEIVPTLYVGDTTPSLAPTLDVVDFCHATRTEIEIDLYLCLREDEA